MNKLVLVFMVLLVFTTPLFAMGQPPQLTTVTELQGEIQSQLNQMDADVAQAAQTLSTIDLSSPDVSPILDGLYRRHAALVDCVTISPTGIMLVVEPISYKYSQGTDISQQEHIIKMDQTHQPVLSRSFKTVEGFWAVTLAYPVFSPIGEFKGSVSLVLQPDALFRNAINKFQPDKSLEVFSLQIDGRLIYDKDILQVGNILFTNPAYQAFPSVLKFADKATREASGTGAYDYFVLGQSAPRTKAAQWTTVGLHGTEWRIVVARI